MGAFLLPESPRFLLEKGRIDELKETMEVVASFNQKDLRWNPALYKPKPDEIFNDEESH